MKFISWNLNGIKSSIKKGLSNFVNSRDADFYLFQETKADKGGKNIEINVIDGYHDYWCSSTKKKGYSGVSTLAKNEPISIKKGIGIEQFDEEGRVLTLEYDKFYLINVYFPNAGRNLDRLGFKGYFNKEFLVYCQKLRGEKPVIIGGDFNVAYEEKDLANPDTNQENAGFTIEEREWFSHFLSKGYIDTYREFVEEGGHYTYWTYRYNARERNIGWRIDYFVICEELKEKLKNTIHLEDVKGSDHCPILLKMEFKG
ncbi:MAG: exodeoxyribonuclease III [Promethearchaeia archaeon]